ncbi:DUF547 domain-containing protein [Natronospira bacteriovora]|uniref:DUF547 domain-containing protein n=1 Tax=Natronospira bacteriovora TaxID=3069753 RepID=A0ABU0W5U5_9GAMM|nr:DUF547 domain-containing protein [Natronospira sp. AB-CW4]MDQ2068830.1 DUF547 domain-containing protein [Natronospira sp. AB-CW4]
MTIRLLTALLLFFILHPASADSMEALFADYQALLEKHLSEKDLDQDGLVSAFDYQAALDDEDSMERVSRQREALKDFDPDTLDEREAANAFWLNAYNFFMIAHILEEKPDGKLVESVWDYGGRYNPLRKNVFERELFEIGGRQYSLDGMEKDTLLGDDFQERDWADARVHFAVNCASVGCPPLRKQIYTADNLGALLAENTRRALNTERHLKVDGRTLYLTRLFDWYENHFKWEADSVRDWIKAHADDRVGEKIDETDRIRYISYDWKLNKPGNFSEFD